MNTIRNLLFSAVIALTGITACNYTVGECYRRGEGGGSGSESVAAGGGIIFPTGVGGYGDEPPKEPQDARESAPLECNATEEQPDKEQPDKGNDDSPDDDGSYEAGLKVFCLKPDHGVICSERCMAKGLGCVPLAAHPYKADAELGRLYACNNLILGFMCSYAYPNGDSCHLTFGSPFPKTCSYTGKD